MHLLRKIVSTLLIYVFLYACGGPTIAIPKQTTTQKESKSAGESIFDPQKEENIDLR